MLALTSPAGMCALQVLTGMFSPTSGRIDDRWAAFMRFQIARARQCFADAEAGVDDLDADARWPVWSALILYRCVPGPLPCILCQPDGCIDMLPAHALGPGSSSLFELRELGIRQLCLVSP